MPQRNNNMTQEKRAQLQKAFLAAMKKTLGNVTQSCQIVGIDRTTYYNWKKSPRFQKQVEEVNEIQKDFVESSFMKGIQDGNPTLIIFYLKTRAKDRGYTERLEIKADTTLTQTKPMTPEEARAFLDKLEQDEI